MAEAAERTRFGQTECVGEHIEVVAYVFVGESQAAVQIGENCGRHRSAAFVHSLRRDFAELIEFHQKTGAFVVVQTANGKVTVESSVGDLFRVTPAFAVATTNRR